MRLILIRHGETEWNRVGRCQGKSDVDLSPEGRLQALKLARYLEDHGVRAVYSSDLKRALHTARLVASRHGLGVIVEPDLREMDQGEFEGIPFTEIRENHGELLKRWRSHPETVRLPGGECLMEVQERVFGAIERIAGRHLGQIVVAVSHNFAISTLLCKLLGLALTEFASFGLKVSCTNHIRLEDGLYRVDRINDVAHLAVHG